MSCASRTAAFLFGAAAYTVETAVELTSAVLAVPAAVLAVAVPEGRENGQ